MAQFTCWHRWACRMGTTNCGCWPYRCLKCGVLYSEIHGEPSVYVGKGSVALNQNRRCDEAGE